MRGEKEDIKTSEKQRENKRERFPNTRYTIQSKGKATAESQSTTRNTRKHKTYAYNTNAYGSVKPCGFGLSLFFLLCQN
jgi:hypothetical protein